MTKRKTQKKLKRKSFRKMLDILIPIETKEETPQVKSEYRKETLRIPEKA